MDAYKAVDLKGPRGTKAIVHIPGWVNKLGGSGGFAGAQDSYAAVPLIYRAVQLRAGAMAQIPVTFYDGDTELDEWPFPQAFDELIWKTEAALMLKGAAYWLRLRNQRKLLGAQWLNPFTVEVKTEKAREDGEEKDELVFRQQVGGKTYGPWTSEQMAYFREFSPSDDVGPGTAAAEVALENAHLHDYATRFAAEFFKGGAMPTILLGVPSSTSESERKRLEGWFSRAVSGVSRAFRVLAVRAEEIKATVLTQPIKDLAMPDLMQQARQQVALAFGIPQTMLEDAANYATAEQHNRSFWAETVVPRCPMYERAINEQFLLGTDIRVEFRPHELEILQEDEADRAGSLNTLTRAGVPLRTAMEVLGYDLSDEQWETIPRVNGRRPVAPPASVPAGQDEQIPEELRRWERMAVRRFREGKPEKMQVFEAKYLTGGMVGAVQAQLEAAQTEHEVRAVFRLAAADA